MEITNLRDTLPLNPRWNGQEIGYRDCTRFITLHYNGPEVPEQRQYGAGLMHQLEIDLTHQCRPGAFGVPIGGDGLQYHYVVSSDGKTYQTRNELNHLWHCGNTTGNAQSLSVHLPIGGKQKPSDQMWAGCRRLIEYLRRQYNIPRSAVVGHMEWSSSLCPGMLMPLIIEYRNEPDTPIVQRNSGKYVCVYPATVRQDYTINGQYVMTLQRGHEVEIDAWLASKDKTGRGTGWWGHWATGLGFIHESAFIKS